MNICNIQTPAKHHLITQVLWDTDADIDLLQEVSSVNNKFIPGNMSIVNTDYNIRGTAILIKDHIEVQDIKMLPDFRGISVKLGDVNVINIYAPSGSQHKRDRLTFFGEHISLLFSPAKHTIIGGDFNCVLSAKDQSGQTNICPTLARLVNELDSKILGN